MRISQKLLLQLPTEFLDGFTRVEVSSLSLKICVVKFFDLEKEFYLIFCFLNILRLLHIVAFNRCLRNLPSTIKYAKPQHTGEARKQHKKMENKNNKK